MLDDDHTGGAAGQGEPVHHRGGDDSHEEAATLLASADRDAAKHLRTLLRLKTKAGYGHTPATLEEVKKANRAADALVEKARRVRLPTHVR